MEHQLNNLGKLVTDTGEVVMEMFSAPTALTEGADAISQGLYLLSEILQRGSLADACGGGLGGEYGYGATFENDTFLMRPFCWCEKDDCLWCGGTCGCDQQRAEWFLDDKPIKNWMKANEKIVAPMPHDVAEHDTPEYEKASRIFEASIVERDRRLITIYPAATHTCQPKGMFDDHERGKTLGFRSAPNFWHKPSGFKVTWYKWIGRDMDTNRPDIAFGEWQSIYEKCLTSLPQEARNKAEAEHAFENTPEYKEREVQEHQRMMEVMIKVVDSGKIRGYCIPFD